MLQPRSIVSIADNSGGKIGRVFKVLGSSKKRYAEIGEIVVISIQKAKEQALSDAGLHHCHWYDRHDRGLKKQNTGVLES